MTQPQVQNMTFTEKTGKFLLSPWSSAIGMTLGALMGIFYKELVPDITPFGSIYISFISMCIVPILVTAISSSLAELILDSSASGDGMKKLRNMAMILFILVGICALAGVLGGIIGKPGVGLSDEKRSLMSGIVDNSAYAADIEMAFYSDESLISDNKFSFTKFIINSIPTNIFKTFSSGSGLQVLFFAIILGIALGSLKKEQARAGISMLESFYHAFIRIIRWSMYLLPFGLFFLIAEHASKLGIGLFIVMAGFLIVYYAVSIVLCIFGILSMCRFSGFSFKRIIEGLKDPLIMAFGTKNSLATMPVAVDAMVENLKYDEKDARLFLSLGITLGRFGSITYFALIGIFTAQLYDTPITFSTIVIIIVFSSLAGMATSGATGIITLTMVMIVLEPLTLPWDAVLVLLIAIDSISDPVRTVVNVLYGCVFTSILAKNKTATAAEHTCDPHQETAPESQTA